MKRFLWNILIGVLILASLVILIVFGVTNKDAKQGFISASDEEDTGTIVLSESGTKVNFSDVLLSEQKESRKLIVSEQTGTIEITLEKNMLDKLGLDWDITKKSQTIYYTASTNFIVDLSELSSKDISDNKQEKTLTIYVPYPVLEDIDVDPYQIKISEVKTSLFARGNINLPVTEYTKLEQNIRARFHSKFNTAENGQKASSNAEAAVKAIYEPIVKAIDKDYKVNVIVKNRKTE